MPPLDPIMVSSVSSTDIQIIGDVLKFVRWCPKCNKKLIYTTKGARDSAVKNKQTCGACAKTKPVKTGQKVCRKCNKSKSLDCFAENGRERRTSACKDCHREMHLQSEYGISLEDYRKMVAQQNGLCAICLKPEKRKDPSGNIGNLVVDHDHLTGTIRGLLCAYCNSCLSPFEKDPKIVQRLVDHLEPTFSRFEGCVYFE